MLLTTLFSRAISLRNFRQSCGNMSAIRQQISCYSSSSNYADFLLPLERHTVAHAPPIVYHPAYSAPQLRPGHRFPMGVFRRIYEHLATEGMLSPHPTASTTSPPGVHIPPALPPPHVLHLAHSPEYVDAFCSGTLDATRVRAIGFGETTSTNCLVERTLSEVGGTLLTALLAIEYGLACNTAGGTHHAFADRGSGFCILNDLATTARVLLETGRAQRVLIVDLDVHQGDGTAAILAHDPRIYTLSVHAASNFPARKQQSTHDVALADGVGDDEYLGTVGEIVPSIVRNFQPDIVLYDAGVDTHQDDALGRLAMTDAGLMRREMLVLDTCLAHGIPVAGYVGGGYHVDLDVLARRHCILHHAAAQLWRDYQL